MKHFFIFNPAAGKVNAAPELLAKLEKLKDVDWTFYETKEVGDATRFAQETCAKYPDEELRFYACGGDGTLNETAAGLIGVKNAALSSYPCGSGNDYVKYYGGKDAFLDVERLIRGTVREVDLMRVNDRYCVNVFDFGLDAVVGEHMIRLRRTPVIGGKRAYSTGVVLAILFGMRTSVRVTVDGEDYWNGPMLLCTVANGNYVGGAYRCAPRAKTDDGLLEVCLVRPISRLTFLRLMGAYRKGEHLDDPRFAKYIHYTRAKTFTVAGVNGTHALADGEIVRADGIRVECLPHAIRFAVPEKEN